jgi:CDP-paratose 2-epimerase
VKILITGIAGFVGSTLALKLRERGFAVSGIDNLMRPGSETNRARLIANGVAFVHGDIRAASDWETLPPADWVIDAAANPSVLAGVQGAFSSRQLLEHNLSSLLNVLEYCKTRQAGLILLSSSRVYSIPALVSLPLVAQKETFTLDISRPLPMGVSARGIGVDFSTRPPVSLYGSTKLASESLALEYGEAFGFPVWVNRCGVLAGAGQFGTPDQGIFAYWVNAHRNRWPLRYIGFEGTGHQVRDALHPHDLADLIEKQMRSGRSGGLYVAGGGPENAWSLKHLNRWCDERFGAHTPRPDPAPRLYDVPWVAMDSSDAMRDFDWRPAMNIEAIVNEIAEHSLRHPDWLGVSGLFQKM